MIDNTLQTSVPLTQRACMRSRLRRNIRVIYISQIIALMVPIAGVPSRGARAGTGAGVGETGDMEASEEGAESCDGCGGDSYAGFGYGPD